MAALPEPRTIDYCLHNLRTQYNAYVRDAPIVAGRLARSPLPEIEDAFRAEFERADGEVEEAVLGLGAMGSLLQKSKDRLLDLTYPN